MRKKIFASAFLVIIPIVIALLFATEIFMIVEIFTAEAVPDKVIAAVLALFLTCIIFRFVIALNETACVIWIDEKKGTLNRKGLIYGYKYSLKIKDIKEVIVHCFYTSPHSKWLAVITDYEKDAPFGNRDTIRIHDTREGRAFLRQIYDGEFRFISREDVKFMK